MHLSKRILYLGIIGYSLALLILQDWAAMTASVGTISALWLGKMFVDIAFAGAAGVRLAGPALFAEDEQDDEVAIHAEDMAFSDTALFGFFLLNVVANLGFHAYETVLLVGGMSFYFSIWTIVEAVVLFLTWVLFSHARKSQRRAAAKARAEAKAHTTPIRKGHAA
jgi:hypothetical protein